MKVLVRIVGVVILLMALLVLGAFFWVNSSNQATGEIPDEGITFRVGQGATLVQIARELETLKAIRSQWLLRMIAKAKGTEGSLKKGTYRIEANMTTFDIHNLIVTGRQQLYKVTLPEGFSLQEIAHRFDEAGITSEEAFLEAAADEDILKEWKIPASDVNGYLYPNTYYFQKEFPAEKVVSHLLETFFTELTQVFPEHKNMSPAERHEAIILASIIEQEYRAPEEAPLISSVFQNRLDIGMPLQSCATVAYIITDIEGKPHPDRILFSDLEHPSPFNTYQKKGLPPAPICNPGLVAVEAAFKPAKTDYLYFVVKDPSAGRHQFSRTLEEHNQARDFLFTKRRSQ